GQSRSPAWQKLLLGRAPVPQRYEQVAWIDPDVLINAAKAPNLFEHVPPGKIGATLAHPQAADPIFADWFGKLLSPHTTLADYAAALYAACGLPPVAGPLVSSSVLACATRDLAWMEELYHQHEPGPQSFQEQVFLSNALQRREFFHPLDPRFS